MSLQLSCWSPSVLPASSGMRTSKLGLLLDTQSELSFGVSLTQQEENVLTRSHAPDSQAGNIIQGSGLGTQ